MFPLLPIRRYMLENAYASRVKNTYFASHARVPNVARNCSVDNFQSRCRSPVDFTPVSAMDAETVRELRCGGRRLWGARMPLEKKCFQCFLGFVGPRSVFFTRRRDSDVFAIDILTHGARRPTGYFAKHTPNTHCGLWELMSPIVAVVL